MIHCDHIRFIPGIQGSFSIQNSVNTAHLIRIKEKSYMIISIDTEWRFDKIKYLFVITLNKLGIRNQFSQTDKFICKIPTANILNGER